MWPLNLPASEVLKLPGGGQAPPWARFDAAWYRRHYPEVTAVLVEATDEALLRFYLERGQRLGHSPNLWFSERDYRRRYRGISEAIASGSLASGFDSYCRGNCLGRRPHWLFDEVYYRRRYPDLTDEILQQNGLANGYSHYLSSGNKEGRIGHPLFDPKFYAATFPPEEAERILADGPFQHYLRRIDRGEPEVHTSPYFDPSWYLTRYPAVADAIAAGEWRCALEHYLCNDTPTQFDPLPEFSEVFYLAKDANLVTAVEKRHFHNGYDHFLRIGTSELRSPGPTIDLRWYANQGPVKAALERQDVPDAFTHWLTIGARRGMPSRPPATATSAAPPSTEMITRRRAQNLLPLFGRQKLRFDCDTEPDLSIIMLLHNEFARTMATLAALRDNHAGAIDMIIVDRGSTDECRYIERYASGLQRLRFETPISVPAARNAALQHARASAVLLVDHDTTPAHGAIGAALRRLRSDPSIGAVCGMMIGEAGLLASAGGIVWRDGSLQDYARDTLPLAPEANFVRDVSFGSSRFLLVNGPRLTAVGGFDDNLGSGPLADADLCLRLSAAGARVVYDPAVVVQLADGADAPPATDRAKAMATERHRADLLRRPERTVANPTLARHADDAQRRLLLIEDLVPLRTLGSGFVRTNDLIRAMAGIGWGITVFPLKGCSAEVSHVFADLPDTVEVMYDRTLGQLRDFLHERRRLYDVVWIARTHNLDSIVTLLAEVWPGSPPERPRLILDTEAIAALRTQGRQALDGKMFNLDAAIVHEFANAGRCDHIVAVSDREALLLRRAGFADVSVLGHVRTPQPTPRAFARRAGMLFVGAIHEENSPNYDSLCWFAEQVLPRVEAELGWETRVTVAGYVAPGVRMDRFAKHPRITLCAAVPSLEPLYDSHRLFVAPTRYAAGAPYKVFEAASHGLPVVATSLLIEQLGWQDGEEILGASASDPTALAARIVRLYRDEALWQRLRDGALSRLAQENGPETYRRPLLDLLGPPRPLSEDPSSSSGGTAERVM